MLSHPLNNVFFIEMSQGLLLLILTHPQVSGAVRCNRHFHFAVAVVFLYSVGGMARTAFSFSFLVLVLVLLILLLLLLLWLLLLLVSASLMTSKSMCDCCRWFDGTISSTS